MDGKGNFFLGLITGLAAGAVIGLLLAPDKGSSTFKKIEGAVKDAADDFFKQGKEASKSVKKLAKDH